MGKLDEIYQALIKVFVRNNKRFPYGNELDDLVNQAKQVLDGALTYNIDQAKGKNIDEITVMEQVTDKPADQLIDDYLSNEANKANQAIQSQEPTFTKVDETKLPKAQIEALPLADKEKAEAAVKKKIEAQNVQAKQSIEGGESSGGQRGAPELVDKNFGQTLYIDSSEMLTIMDDAQKKFDAASDAVAQGDYDLARGILRYEIEDNYKLPQATRDAAYDARIFIRRGEGLAKDMGYDTDEEILEALNEKITEGVQTTYKDNWPLYTAPDDVSNMKSIEYVDFLDEAGEDFGTPNSQIIKPDDIGYEYATGGRVGFNEGGSFKDFVESTGDDALMDLYIDFLNGQIPEDVLKEALEKKGYKTYATGGRVGFSNGGIRGKILNMINKISKRKKVSQSESEDFAKLLDEIDQAKKAGIIDEKGFQSFKKGIESLRKSRYEGKMENPTGIEGVKSALPVDDQQLVPKTNLKKVRAQKKAFDETEKELAKSGQISVKDQTDPSTLTTEELIKFRKTNRAGKGQFTNAEAIIVRLENTIRDIKPNDETYEYVTTTFPNFIKELKANPKLAENDNVFNTLMGGLPNDQRFIRYDDGTVDFQTKKTTHNFKLRKDLDTDRTGPNVSDDNPNMFDDMFDRMQKEMQDYIPGEDPLTKKKKRTLNAEGGLNYLLGF